MDGKNTILIVDDEPQTFEVVKGFLHHEGYNLVLATSGAEVLARLDELKPDVILLDVLMPKMNGFELCRQLKADERWRHIPVILVTILGSTEDLVRGFEAGADDFLHKPVSDRELRARVRSMLRIKTHYDELKATLRLKEDLANMIAHDMRTPLTFIEIRLHAARSSNESPIDDTISGKVMPLTLE